jgi:hypothetical protein
MKRIALHAGICAALAVSTASAQQPVLGPADGRDLPALDTSRVGVGSMAPDFTLGAMAGGTVTLSQFRGRKNVLLVFYRGHW